MERDEESEPEEDALDFSRFPHDAFFKSVFSEPEHALRFFRNHLPPAIAAEADWDTLEPVPGSFVKSTLNQVHSDLLFSIRIGGRGCLLYLLLEHQSTPDPAMPLRLLAYVNEILQRHHRERGLPLPPVLPFVLHQGPERWTAPTTFEELFELPETVGPQLLEFLPTFRHALLDLSRADPISGESDAVLRVVLLLMKLARERRLPRFFRWMAGIAAEQIPDPLLKLLLLYALHTEEDLDVEEIYGNLTSNPELRKRTMSVAEKLKAEGRQEGRQEGVWIGKIQSLEEFLGLAVSPREELEAFDPGRIEARYRELHRDYEARFKTR